MVENKEVQEKGTQNEESEMTQERFRFSLKHGEICRTSPGKEARFNGHMQASTSEELP